MKNVLPLFFLISIFLISSSNSESKKILFENGNIKYQADYSKGIFNGEFVSFYKNGRVKISGNFKKNQRSGEWRFNDSLGNLIALKKYENSHQFEFIKLLDKNENEVEFNIAKRYSEEDLESYKSLEVDEDNVIIARRIWRNLIPTRINDAFFTKESLKREIQTQLKNNKLIAIEERKTKEMQSFADKLSEYKITHYKILEDWYYNKQTHLLEVQIIAICPVGAKEGEKKYKELFWFYYPSFVENVSKNDGFKVSQANEFEKKFYYRNFNSEIYKVENIYDKELRELKDDEDYRSKVIEAEMNIVEMEHTALMHLVSL